MFATLTACLALLTVSAYAAVFWFLEPPEVDRAPVQREALAAPQLGDLQEMAEVDADGNIVFLPPVSPLAGDGWRPGVYTILIAGEDDGFGGNDVIMVVLFDTHRGEVDVLSIPRDTIVNVPWGIKKLNSYQHLYRLLPEAHDHYIYALRDGVEKLIGYQTDFWITVDLDGFSALVDAIGGVDFYVPQRMVYSDPEQGLFINLQPGVQRLTGQQAEGLVRFRTFPSGDIQRIQTQHAFLGALADQLLSARGLLAIDDLLRTFRDHVETDLTLRNLAFFATEFLRMDHSNIRFHSVDAQTANIADHVNGISYVSLFVEPWVELLNRYMNPFTWEIRAGDLEILTRDPVTGQFFTTNGAPWTNNWVR